jgi:hypothetical protein
MINDNSFVYIIRLQNSMQISVLMQQERSGTFLVLFRIDTDIPPVDYIVILVLDNNQLITSIL